MSRKSRRNSTRSHSHQTHREFNSDERDLREHLERRAQQAIHGENSVQRKFFSTEYNLEIQNLERRNSEYALFESQRELESQKQQLLMANLWADQAQRERIRLCSELEMNMPHTTNRNQKLKPERGKRLPVKTSEQKQSEKRQWRWCGSLDIVDTKL